ncbi:hypothetical protein ABZ342_00645 [Amycolatopsis sp. NPDC005961]|uniref:hypothetical protein n=1 Tax=Amycolatopsis sp. NPDC005961 TaxID=3156720 RepID=UPI0033F2C705
MRLPRGMAALCVLACVTACSGPPPAVTPPAVPPPPATTSHPPTPARTTTSPPPAFVSPAEVTAACPFVTVDDITHAIGGSWSATAVEQPAEKDSFLCTYKSEFHDAAAFQLRILVPVGRSPRGLSADIAKSCAKSPVAVPGTGDAAFHCQGPDQDIDGIAEKQTRIVVTKTSHGRTRAGVLDLHTIRDDVYVALAKLLGERL